MLLLTISTTAIIITPTVQDAGFFETTFIASLVLVLLGFTNKVIDRIFID